MHQALSHRPALAALHRLPKTLKISQPVVSLSLVPFFKLGLDSVSGLLSGCPLERQRPVSVLAEAGYTLL